MSDEPDAYVIFWHHPSPGGDQHFETYVTDAEAQAALAEFARCYPWNAYYLAKIVGEQPATQQEPKPRVSFAGPTGSGATCEVTVKDNVITGVTVIAGPVGRPPYA